MPRIHEPSVPPRCVSETVREAEVHEVAVREVAVHSGHDVQVTVDAALAMLRELPFTRPIRFQIATAVSELARNLVVHAGGGLVRLCVLEHQGRQGFEIATEDEGPGIADIDLALTEGFSTANSLGLGLPGVQRMMDKLHFDEGRAVGTRIVARKWM